MNGFAAPKNADQPVSAATRACILAIGLDRLARQAEYDGYAAAVLDDYRRLRAGDIGRRECAGDELTDCGLSYAEVDAALDALDALDAPEKA